MLESKKKMLERSKRQGHHNKINEKLWKLQKTEEDEEINCRNFW